MPLTFKGGVFPEQNKKTKKMPIVSLPSPLRVSIPLECFDGVYCKPIVTAGDYVAMGQLVAVCGEPHFCNVHASVSGIVLGVEEKIGKRGETAHFLLIENDFKNILCGDIFPFSKKITDTSPEEIADIVKKSGVVNFGTEGCSAYKKLISLIGKANKLVINCCEPEPYITSTHRLLLDEPIGVINGAKILMRALSVREAVIAIDENKKDAVSVVEGILNSSELIEVKTLKTKYPQNNDIQLVKALFGKESSNEYAVFSAQTVAAIYDAFVSGMPHISNVVTVSGTCIAEPKNLRVPLGTSYEDVINFCGGFTKEPDVVVDGSIMSGEALWDLGYPVTKSTFAILALDDIKSKTQGRCIRCGKCAQVCPMQLMPSYIACFSEEGKYNKCLEWNIFSCIECGCCAYVCPDGYPIIRHIKVAKEVLKNTAEEAKK